VCDLRFVCGRWKGTVLLWVIVWGVVGNCYCVWFEVCVWKVDGNWVVMGYCVGSGGKLLLCVI
jgi:hypothetical protein